MSYDDIMLTENPQAVWVKIEVLNAALKERDDARQRLAAAEAENKRLRMQNMDLLEIALEQALVYRDDNGQLRFTDSGDLVGKEG